MQLHENFNLTIEILGTIAFAMSGAFAAMERRFDPFGVLIIAFITSVGGGTIRDLLLQKQTFWMTNISICAVIFFATMLAFLFKYFNRSFRVTLFIFDSLGLGLFTIIGVQKGIHAELHPAICITLGTITGCFGGVLRDILLNRIPLIFRKEIYATPCIVGGALFLWLSKWSTLSYASIQISTIALIVTIRTLAVYYKWAFPKFYIRNHNELDS